MRRVHTILYVRDQAASRDFYRTVLEREPTLDVPGMTEIEMSPGHVLGLMPEHGITRLLGDAVDPSRLRGAGRAELYVVVDDVDAAHARALRAGAVELAPAALRDWGDVVAYSADRDGYVIAFASAPAR